MKHNYEIIRFEEDLPINILLHRLGSVKKHWHKSIELLFILDGEVQLTVNDLHYSLCEEDIILINRNDLHELYSTDATLIAVQIDLERLALPDGIENLRFDCFSQNNMNQSFQSIKQLIAQMVFSNAKDNHATYSYNLSLAYALVSQLLNHFQSAEQKNTLKTEKHLERLTNIMTYIKDHYQDNLTLNEVASREHLSAPYLSSFFDKYIGMNFSTYYDKLRIDYAVNDLISTDLSIEDIALKHGFSETRSFLRAFKKEYQTLPSVYRKNHKSIKKSLTSSDDLINYMDFEPSFALDKLNKYFETPKTTHNLYLPGHKIKQVKPVITDKDGIKLKHTIRTFTAVGRAKELLYTDIQNMLGELQATVGYDYIKFHGLFSDDLLVVKRKPNKELIFSFVMIDKVLDFLESINLKPLIQLSFMPEAMASIDDKHVFDAKMNTSLPRNIDEWNQLVDAFIHHIELRYGKNRIEDWLYCVWNEPDTSYQMFGVGDDQKFFDFYKSTYDTIKRINGNLVFGSPSLLLITKQNMDWAIKFLEWTQHFDCLPEFLNLHYYGDDFENSDTENALSLPYKSKLSLDDLNFNKYIDQVKLLLKDFNLNIPIYLTEWNVTVSHRNLINDTVFIGCYLAKNILSNYDRLDSFGYWSLTDFIEEFQLDNKLFHGGLGLFTYNGIKKPHYYVLDFISRLGKELIQTGDGYFITKEDDSLKIILYNYEHYNKIFADGNTYTMTHSNRYNAFSNHLSLDFQLPLIHLEPGNYLVKEYIVNQQHGSAFDKWVDIGSIELETPEDMNILKHLVAPNMQQYYQTVADHQLDYFTTLEPLEVKYVEIKKIDNV